MNEVSSVRFKIYQTIMLDGADGGGNNLIVFFLFWNSLNIIHEFMGIIDPFNTENTHLIDISEDRCCKYRTVIQLLGNR